MNKLEQALELCKEHKKPMGREERDEICGKIEDLLFNGITPQRKFENTISRLLPKNKKGSIRR